MDDLSLDAKCTGASLARWNHDWNTQKTYLGTNKEVFNAELYTMGDALEIALKNRRVRQGASIKQAEPGWKKIYIWADSQVTIKRLQHTSPSPGEWLARRIIEKTQLVLEQGTAVEIH